MGKKVTEEEKQQIYAALGVHPDNVGESPGPPVRRKRPEEEEAKSGGGKGERKRSDGSVHDLVNDLLKDVTL